MIGALIVAMFQAVAGPPVQPPQDPSPPATEEAAAPASDSELQARLQELRQRQKLVCRNETTVGSRLPKRRCTSKADDEAATSDSRAWIDRVQSQMPTKF